MPLKVLVLGQSSQKWMITQNQWRLLLIFEGRFDHTIINCWRPDWCCVYRPRIAETQRGGNAAEPFRLSRGVQDALKSASLIPQWMWKWIDILHGSLLARQINCTTPCVYVIYAITDNQIQPGIPISGCWEQHPGLNTHPSRLRLTAPCNLHEVFLCCHCWT